MPLRKDIVGTWVSSDGAIIAINESGAFTAQSFPSRIFYWKAEFNETVKGSGNWEIRKSQTTDWELFLNFKEYSGPDSTKGFGLPIFISQKQGVKYLFLWKEDQEGEKYTFQKK